MGHISSLIANSRYWQVDSSGRSEKFWNSHHGFSRRGFPTDLVAERNITRVHTKIWQVNSRTFQGLNACFPSFKCHDILSNILASKAKIDILALLDW